MSETKVQIPDGMLTAAWEKVAERMKQNIKNGLGGYIAELHVARIASEAAICWLDVKLTRMRKDTGSLWRHGYNTAIEDVRRMYLAPASEVGPAAKNVIQSMMGCTFTTEEANEIEKHLSYASNGWIPSCAPKEEPPKTEAPEYIKYFSKWIDVKYPGISRQWETELFLWTHNRRGQKSVSK